MSVALISILSSSLDYKTSRSHIFPYKRLFPRRFNVEYTRSVYRVAGIYYYIQGLYMKLSENLTTTDTTYEGLF